MSGDKYSSSAFSPIKIFPSEFWDKKNNYKTQKIIKVLHFIYSEGNEECNQSKTSIFISLLATKKAQEQVPKEAVLPNGG
jgi:hypothetical protein